ncbi:hypothetical protein LUU34_00948700 [Aix galericulata]|nr:hypothetical protein LUU34_00948700 [Aix galericulata]
MVTASCPRVGWQAAGRRQDAAAREGGGKKPRKPALLVLLSLLLPRFPTYAGITINIRSAVSVWGKFIRATKCTRPSNEGNEQQYPSVKSQLITRHSVTEPRNANNRGTNNVTSHASISEQGDIAYES